MTTNDAEWEAREAQRAAFVEEARRWRAREAISPERWREIERDEKAKCGAMLDAAKRYGEGAYRVAINLIGSGLTYREILTAAKKAPAGPPSDQVHRSVIRPDASFGEREDSPGDEADWLRQAREQAEREWAALHPQRKTEAAKLQNMRPSEVAFHQMTAGLARDAASLRYHDGQARYCGDTLDESLRHRGEQAARRLWPGR